MEKPGKSEILKSGFGIGFVFSALSSKDKYGQKTTGM